MERSDTRIFPLGTTYRLPSWALAGKHRDGSRAPFQFISPLVQSSVSWRLLIGKVSPKPLRENSKKKSRSVEKAWLAHVVIAVRGFSRCPNLKKAGRRENRGSSSQEGGNHAVTTCQRHTIVDPWRTRWEKVEIAECFALEHEGGFGGSFSWERVKIFVHRLDLHKR